MRISLHVKTLQIINEGRVVVVSNSPTNKRQKVYAGIRVGPNPGGGGGGEAGRAVLKLAQYRVGRSARMMRATWLRSKPTSHGNALSMKP